MSFWIALHFYCCWLFYWLCVGECVNSQEVSAAVRGTASIPEIPEAPGQKRYSAPEEATCFAGDSNAHCHEGDGLRQPAKVISAPTEAPLAPLVSCLCVTRQRVAMLHRAVECFRQQTYTPRELIVLFEADDPATRQYLASIGEASDPAMSIRGVEASVVPKKLTLGALRNLAVSASRGHYIAQWDDDDWHAPQRLAKQIEALRSAGKQACVLLRWTLFDELTKMAYISAMRYWEGSLVAERRGLSVYPALKKGEDTPNIKQLAARSQLHTLDRPDLYCYIHHGTNTYDRKHWETNIVGPAQPLSPENTAQIIAVLQLNREKQYRLEL